MRKIARSDSYVALLTIAVVALLAWLTTLFSAVDRKVYDLAMNLSDHPPSDKIALIAIDEQSIANLGRWPWSRDIHARLIERLAAGGAKVIGHTTFFFEPQRDAGWNYINRIRELYGASSKAFDAAGVTALPAEYVQIGGVADEALQALNPDQSFAASLEKAGNVVLPMYLELGEPQGKPDKPLPEYIERMRLEQSGDSLFPSLRALYPIESLGTAAAGVGVLLQTPDEADGAIRHEPLALQYFGHSYPSLALTLAARSLNLERSDIRLQSAAGELRLGKLRIATDPQGRMLTYFYRDKAGRPAFPVDSFFDVYSGKIPPDKYRDKIVLIGATAAGVGSSFVTPVSATMPPVQTLAHAVSSILQEDFFLRPAWSGWIGLGAALLVCLYLLLALPRLAAGPAAVATLLLFGLLLLSELLLLLAQQMWLPLTTAAVLLLIGYVVLTTKRFLVTERGKLRSDQESADNNRMLGLAFQGQGQLDLAFDKFRKCPLDDSMMEVMYNLALDFERKRQFNKATAVFEYMAGFKRNYRDLEQRLARSRQMQETVVLGGGSGKTNASTLVTGAAGVEKPMLGRYQVEKELGKGAMGVVYLGRDPKIGRVVAIKTMALAEEFDGNELDDARKRFFREAETAGRLSHPNIVTIYDAGEEHDLAYIAMEFLKGRDLTPYTTPGQLLPVKTVLQLGASVAEALAYAHAQNVVHRDIKPANIMYEPESASVKVTDFGVARITDASRTKTGMVLGTPSYMSPEQLSGKKIDGRSDLFSLGSTLFQLLCGQLPFSGDSMAELMFRIANEAHPDILALRPELPPALKLVLDKALAKNADERFQSGADFANALRRCVAMLKES